MQLSFSLTKITSVSLLSSLLIGAIPLSHTLLFSSQVNAQTIGNSRSRDINIREQGYLNRRTHKTYSFRGKANQSVTISLKSREFNTYLELYNPSGRLIAENDNTNDTNSQITLNLPSSGTYTVVAKGARKFDKGQYLLTIESGSSFQPPRSPQPSILPSREKSFLPRGRTIQHTFQGNRGQAISISLESRQFSPRFTLYNPKGNIATEIDDFNGGKSEIEMKLPDTGVYTVEVRAMRSDGEGEYILNLANQR